MKKIKYISFAAALLTALQSLCVSPAGAQSAGNTEYNGEKAVLTVYTDVKQYIETLEPALEDDIATVYFDKNTANIAYLKKSTGEIWTSAPVSPCIADITPDEQKRVFSPVILTYTDSSLTEKELTLSYSGRTYRITLEKGTFRDAKTLLSENNIVSARFTAK